MQTKFKLIHDDAEQMEGQARKRLKSRAVERLDAFVAGWDGLGRTPAGTAALPVLAVGVLLPRSRRK